MFFKNNKGITLAVLVVSIIVMLIILGITISTGDTLLRNSQKNRLKTNMYLIKSRASSLLEDYMFDGTDNLGSEVSSSQVTSVGWTEDTSKYIYREWDTNMLKSQGIDTKNIASSERFIIQYNITNEDVDVASVRGFIDEYKVLRHTLSSLEED